MADLWWQDFFDEDYLHIWGLSIPDEQSDREAASLCDLLGLKEGSRLLDAPCGYGRLSTRLAALGCQVVGVDQSETLLAHAEKDRGSIPRANLQYHRHDLRRPLNRDGFDAAINIFSSLGYGTEEEDALILKHLARAVRRGGAVFVDTNHRDAVVATLSRIEKPAFRLPDDTLVVEEPVMDTVTGRMETTWYWSGPKGSGRKSASLRIYTATELVRLLEEAGLQYVSAHQGCSSRPYQEKAHTMIGLLARRP